MIINMKDKYTTRAGREVRILSITDQAYQPVVGLVKTAEGIWLMYAWNRQGEVLSTTATSFDLQTEILPDGTPVLVDVTSSPWEASVLNSFTCPRTSHVFYVVLSRDDTERPPYLTPATNLIRVP